MCRRIALVLLVASCGGSGKPSPDAFQPRALSLTADAAPTGFVLAEVKGEVQIAEGAEFHPAAGGPVAGGARIRTGGNGSAVIRAPDGTEIALADGVDISVEEISSTVARFALGRGKVRAASPATRQLTVDSSGAHTEAKGARFTIYTSKGGLVAVASESGNVKVRARDREVQVGAGQQSIVPPHQAPGDPIPIPDEVFLKVDWPDETLKKDPETLVRGHAKPGERVRVNGVETDVAVDGTFIAKVRLKEGKNNPLVVEAEAMDGKKRLLRGPAVEIRNNLNVEVKQVDWGKKP